MKKFLYIFIGLIIISTEWIDFCNAADSKKNLTKTEVRDLLLARTDFMNYQEIIDFGDRISDGLIEILKESENRLELERVILVIEGLDVDKKQFINPLTGFIKDNTKTESARSIAIQLLGTIAGKDVQNEVFSLLQDNDTSIRLNVLWFLAKYGDPSMADKIRKVLDERLSRTNPEMISKDLTFPEGEKAIEEIKKRAVKEQENEKDKKQEKSSPANNSSILENAQEKEDKGNSKSEIKNKANIENIPQKHNRFAILLTVTALVIAAIISLAVILKRVIK